MPLRLLARSFRKHTKILFGPQYCEVTFTPIYRCFPYGN